MTTNQMLREFAKVLKGAPPVVLSAAEKREIANLAKLVRESK